LGDPAVSILPLFDRSRLIPYLLQGSYARLSPNGKWVAYVSTDVGKNEVFVQTFPNPGSPRQVSTDGGLAPVWSHDGRELFFVSGGKMMAAAVKDGANFEAIAPHPLFDVVLAGRNARFEVSKDGHFLVPTLSEQAGRLPVQVIVNWPAGLKK
jgi:hypothetical protein